jgi:hypothetical protein
MEQFLRNTATGSVYVFELDEELATDPLRYPPVYQVCVCVACAPVHVHIYGPQILVDHRLWLID